MTQDEIIEMARQAGMIADGEMWFSSFYKIEQDVHISHLKAFAKLVAQHEREACAYWAGIALLGADRGLSNRVDQAIRARGQA